MRRCRHLSAPECAALARSPAGSAPLRQPLGLGSAAGARNRGLHPTHGPGRQRKILDFFRIKAKPSAGASGMQSRGMKAEPLDPFSPGIPHGMKEKPLDPFSSGIPHGMKAEPLDPFPPGTPHGMKEKPLDPFSSGIPHGMKAEPLDPFSPGIPHGMKEKPLDPFSPGAPHGMKAEPLDPFSSGTPHGMKAEPLDPFSPGTPHGMKEKPLDPFPPGTPHGMKAEPLDPFSPGTPFGMKEKPLDPFSPGIPHGMKEKPLDPFSPGTPHGMKEKPLDPFPPAPPSPFSSPSLSLPPPRAHPRKRAIPKPEQHLWEEPKEKIPELSGIQQEWQELEVEPLPDSHYGLLGTRSWQVPQGSMDDLPPEILRNIFAFLPVLDLYQSLSLVCRCWREIIRDPQFIPWKKLYHQYLKKEDSALQRVEQILQEFSITKEQQGCVLGLVRLVSSTAPKVDPTALLQILGSHPLFPKAQVCVLSKFPDLQSKPGPEKMWAVFAVMVLFSDGVGDIQRLLECFRSPRSPLAVLEVTEVLHCMATLLLAMRNKSIPISNRLHYNIFYCLYLMENACGIVQPLEEGRVNLCSSGWADVKLTHEQQRILSHKIEPGQTVKIMAFAGTGKTSTLVKYAEKFSELKFLYLAFNKAVAEKGKKVFPRNVTCKTFHSLAFGSIGRHYKEKGKLNFSKMSVYSISFLLRKREGKSLFVRGKTVTQTLENFFSSSDEEICEEHTPLWFKNTHGQMELMNPEEKRVSFWDGSKLSFPLDLDLMIPAELSLGFGAGYSFTIQFFFPPTAIVDIVQSQKCGKILVGDPHQQIYTFRGAVNTLYLLPHTHVYYLTQSFRFGPEIAYVGSTILDVCKGIRSKTLVGGRQKGDVRGGREGKMALLSRSNWKVFEDAVEFSGRDPPAKIHVIGVRDFLIGTVHQAKGLEFDTVCIADDFVQIPSVSRAFLRRMNIALGEGTAPWRAQKVGKESVVRGWRERFLRVELLSEAGKAEDGAPVACCMSGCTKSLELSSGLVVKKLPLTHSDGSQDPGGFLCQACTQMFFGSLTPLTSFPTIQ
uniref:F-box DNA helicase 1 n=1 Tax=Lonchura striata TaxID=40157 RepID=UPI000B4C53EB|nr:F-box DNA helicase 1 [Lonchura striata domestica]